MAHLRLRWRPDDQADLDAVVVDVSVGPGPDHMRRAGILRMHASELNSLDRLLYSGSAMEYPVNTYEVIGPPLAPQVAPESIRSHTVIPIRR